MKRIHAIVFIFIMFNVYTAASQEAPISPAEASKFVGQIKTVCGHVADVTYAATSRGQPTYLNLDKAYPKQIFTVIILGSDRHKFDKAPEFLYVDKDICVTGKIQSYKGKPEIMVSDPSQIRVK